MGLHSGLMRWLRITIATLGFAGALVFGAAFVLSYARPGLVEGLAGSFIKSEVERRVDQRLSAVDSENLTRIASRLSAENAARIATLRQEVVDGLPKRVANVIREMQDIDCACRTIAASMAPRIWDWRIATLGEANERLTAMIRAQYMDVARKLTREFRVFTAANGLVLLMLGLAVVVRKRARVHLAPPAVVLGIAAAAVGYVYLFRQDWLHTILFSQYVGMTYFAYLGTAFLLLGDIILNRARVTTRLLNSAAQLVGSTATVLPC